MFIKPEELSILITRHILAFEHIPKNVFERDTIIFTLLRALYCEAACYFPPLSPLLFSPLHSLQK